MNFKAFLTTIILIGWIITGSYIYTCKIMMLCEGWSGSEASILKEEVIIEDDQEATQKQAIKKDTIPIIDKNDFTEEEKTVLLKKHTVYFQESSTEVIKNEENEKFLQLAKKYLSLKPTGNLLVLIGHTDNTGTAEINLEFGMRRAESVERYLLDKGFQTKQMEISSKGLQEPLMSNDTEEGKAKNRRVEIILQIKE